MFGLPSVIYIFFDVVFHKNSYNCLAAVRGFAVGVVCVWSARDYGARFRITKSPAVFISGAFIDSRLIDSMTFTLRFTKRCRSQTCYVCERAFNRRTPKVNRKQQIIILYNFSTHINKVSYVICLLWPHVLTKRNESPVYCGNKT